MSLTWAGADTRDTLKKEQAFERKTENANQTHLSSSPRGLWQNKKMKDSDREMFSASRRHQFKCKRGKLAVCVYSAAASGLSAPSPTSNDKHGKVVGEFNLRISERM